MRPSARGARLLPVFATALLLSGCPDDVAPGYRIEKQDVVVRYEGGNVQIDAEYVLKNTGRDALDSLRISLADVNPGAALEMRVTVDGKPTQWAALGEGDGRALEVKFSPAWERKQKKRLALEYKFPSGGAARTGSFQLIPGSWSPELLPPPGMLSKGGAAPKNWELRVLVPAALRVHASGKLRGSKTRGEIAEFRFRQEKAHKFTYVVAGRYHETRVTAGDFTLFFWLQRPPPEDELRKIGARLGQSLRAYREWLGPLENDARNVWVVDGSGARYILSGGGRSTVGLAPNMIIDPGLRVATMEASQTVCVADEWLAGMWLYWLARPDRATAPLAEQLAKHFAQALPHGCGFDTHGRTREQVLAALRAGFAAAHRNFEQEKGPMREGFRRERDWYRLRLAVFALEERAGREVLHRAMKRVLQALRGDTWSVNELRSALEAETGTDWAAFFRQWSAPDAIPAE